MKCTTRAQAIQRYGAIDFGARYWARQREWLEMFEVPHGWFPKWHVVGAHGVLMPVEHIALNKDVHTPLLNALTALKDKGLGDLLVTFEGCFNIRMVRGSSASPSLHSYALALDLNASLNPLGAIKHGFYDHPDFVKCFTDQGFDWGGHWAHRKDPMHFSYGWE
jgi:hypothetical protein